MAIGSDYSSPVTVNGYSCRNCADVSLATKRIDPAHPASGPDGADAAGDPSQSVAVRARAEARKAAHAAHDQSRQAYGAHGQATAGFTPGRLVDTHA